MSERKHLYVLWTDDNPVTAEKMLFMYTVNALRHGWWEKVTVVIWGASARLVGGDTAVQDLVRGALKAGVHVSACKACADQLEVTGTLEELGVEVKYWGIPLTEVLKSGESLLTI